jgi:hypothetical protein
MFHSPLGMEELRKIPMVNTAAFLKAGPNTLLTSLNPEQADLLLDLLGQRNPRQVPAALLPERDMASLRADISVLTAKEGGTKLFIHYVQERSARLACAKREAVLKTTGRLDCEACKFDFAKRYGALGEDFCEVHHKEPLSKLKAEIEVTAKDPAIVCSNRHRRIHKDGLKSIGEMKRLLREAKVVNSKPISAPSRSRQATL